MHDLEPRRKECVLQKGNTSWKNWKYALRKVFDQYHTHTERTKNFAQLEHAKAAQSLNGKLEIAGRVIKVSAVTDHLGVQNTGATAADFDDDDGGGLSLNAQSRAMLMQKLDRSGIATSMTGSLGVPVLNGSALNQLPVGQPMGLRGVVPALASSALVVPSPAIEPVGNPSVCLLLKHMFDPETEMEPDFDLDIQEEVQEECSKYGPVKHIYVDKIP